MNHLDDPFRSLSIAFNDPAIRYAPEIVDGALSNMSAQEIASYYLKCPEAERPFIVGYVATSSDPQLQNAFYTFIESPRLIKIGE